MSIMASVNNLRRSPRISNTQTTNEMVVLVLIDYAGRIGLAAARYIYTCSGCGVAEKLVAGTPNTGHRLSLWCIDCFMCKRDFVIHSHLHVPLPIVEDVIMLADRWQQTTRWHREDAIIRYSEVVSSLWDARSPIISCARVCEECLEIQHNLRLWLPEVDGWYDRSVTFGLFDLNHNNHHEDVAWEGASPGREVVGYAEDDAEGGVEGIHHFVLNADHDSGSDGESIDSDATEAIDLHVILQIFEETDNFGLVDMLLRDHNLNLRDLINRTM